MPLQFLAPLFLIAAAAIALPVVLHLIRREQREATRFPSLMFVRQVPHRVTRRRRLRDLPLLALRVLALLLLAGAFARPLLERERGVAAGANTGPREVVILLDRSYSMARAGSWERALAAARAEIDGLGGGDRASLVGFDANAALLSPPGADRVRLRGMLGELRPGDAGTRFDPALRLAGSILAGSPLARREVVVISDLQRIGAGEGIEAKLPPGATLRVVPVAPSAGRNLALGAVSFGRERFAGQERITASARVVNPGAAAASVTVTLEVDGRVLASRSANVGAHAAAVVPLPPFTLAAPVRGRVRLEDDALAADNAWHFALAPDQATRVLVVAPDAGASLFLERALEVGGEPGFRVAAQRSLPASLDGYDVVVVNGAALPGGAAAQALRRWVASGGGLVVALGPASGAATAEALLPGAPGQLVDRTQGGGAALGYVDLAHGALELFRTPRSGDLTAPRFYRYRPLRIPAAGDSAVRVLARFDDGGVALAERRVERGRVLAFASTLDRSWNDLPVQPIFVPLTHRLVRYAAAVAPLIPAHVVDDVVDARAAAHADEQQPLLVVAPSGARTELPPGARALPLAEAGWYTVRAADRADDVLAVIASNVDVRESEPAALPGDELITVATLPGAPGAPLQASAVPLEERERRQSLWWYLLAAAIALLVVETVLSNRGRRAAARIQEGR
ncbi:MAG TPA: VWA domain-containing protein [Longimicrobiales bacterium]|nr:VWA domain-containing protein [Longimicrobiales bacterium]